jgi:hypothetical protein
VVPLAAPPHPAIAPPSASAIVASPTRALTTPRSRA